MKITIERQYDIGTCCGDETLIWMKEEVTPQELKRLIDRCENIKAITFKINNMTICAQKIHFIWNVRFPQIHIIRQFITVTLRWGNFELKKFKMLIKSGKMQRFP